MANNIFSLEVLRAAKGDCLLLHYGTEADSGLALIDGGHRDVYEPFLRPRLEELRTERGLSDDDSLPVDLMMLSHIDQDHVFGLLELTRELRKARDKQKPEIIEIFGLWHNAFDDLIDNDADELIGAVDQTFGPASASGNLASAALDELEDSEIPTVRDTVMVIASIPEGRELRKNTEFLGVERNVEVGGKLIVAAADSSALDMGKGLKFTVVGPMLPEVEKLQNEHRAFLEAHPEIVEAATASVIAKYSDKSKPNLSSLVVLVEVLVEEQSKTILLTGDARGDKILKGLELVGLVDEGGSIHVDVLKCPHHGSARNVELDFFERITADDYVFSGNGEHGNPERVTLELLATARGGDDYRIHLTYPVEEIDEVRKEEWESHHDEPWDAATQSLAAFFAGNPAVGDKVDFVKDGVPYIIDVLEDD